MKRSSFLVAVVALITAPFASWGKKRPPEEIVCREAFLLDEDPEFGQYRNNDSHHHAYRRLIDSLIITGAVKVWETKKTNQAGKTERWRHYMVVAKKPK